MVQSDIEVMNR